MYDQNPILWNKRINGEYNDLRHDAFRSGKSGAAFSPNAVISVLAVALLVGAATTGLIA